MIRICSLSLFLLTVVPMVIAALWMIRTRVTRLPKAARGSLGLLTSIWVSLSLLLLVNPHQDVFTGLDVAIYRLTAKAYQEGRNFHDVDAPFKQVPRTIKPTLLYRSVETPGARQTRDGLFELPNYPDAETSPFFFPTLPLAAAGADEFGLSYDHFVPLLAVLFLMSLLAADVRQNHPLASLIGVILFFSTAWPGWFLRGFHSDVVGAVLVATALLVASQPLPRTPYRSLLIGLLLGLAVSYHPTMAMPAAITTLYVILRSGRIRDTAALALGGSVGTLPLLLINAFGCQPYGDFLSLQTLVAMCRVIPEIKMVVFALVLITVVGVSVLTLAHVPSIRKRFEQDERLRKGGSILCVSVCVIVCTLPYIVGGSLWKGTVHFAQGGSFFLLLTLLGGLALFLRRQPLTDRFLMAALMFVSLVFLFIKGTEVPVGVWSLRRLCPVVLVLIPVLIAPLADAAQWLNTQNRWVFRLLILLPVLISLVHITPLIDRQNNDAGADELTLWMKKQLEQTDDQSLVLFDYYPHSVPYQWNLQRTVFGLNEFAGQQLEHGAVIDWLGQEAQHRPVLIVSSYTQGSQSLVEDGLWLTPSHPESEREAIPKAFQSDPFGRIRQKNGRSVRHALYTALPITASNRLAARQDKVLDGGPLGLRPPWGRIVRGGQWSREGSGIVGTLPPPGKAVRLELAANWYPPATEPEWTNQVLVIVPPFKGNPARLAISAKQTLNPGSVTLIRHADDADDGSLTGVYRIHAERPYDSESYGIRGYGNNLGAVIQSVQIAVVDD